MPQVIHTTPVALWILLSSCAVFEITPYDKTTDVALMQIHGKLVSMIVSVERGEYTSSRLLDNDKADVLSLLEGLAMRASSRPHNELQVSQIALLEESVQDLYGLLSIDDVDSDMAEILVELINESVRSILRLELARGS